MENQPETDAVVLAAMELDIAKKAYEDIADIQEAKAESLTGLLADRRRLEDELAKVNSEIRRIEKERFQQRAEIQRAKEKVKEREHFYEEAVRMRDLESERASKFDNIVGYCKEQGFEWTKLAYKHQWEGALTMAHHGSAILGDGTGTGKTVTAIMAADMVKAKKVLVITPADIVSGFFDAIAMFAPHRNVMPLESANKATRQLASMVASTSNEFTFVVNYEALWRDHSWITDIEWDAVFMDEAHTFKNSKGTSFKAMEALQTKHMFPMTATSILNSPEDIWTSLNLIAPSVFWDKHVFLTQYCRYDSRGKWIFREGGEAAMLKTLGGRIVKRTMEETGIVLPKQHIEEVLVPVADIPVEQAEIINQLNDYAAIALESGEAIQISAMIALITRQRQSVVYPAGIEVRATAKDCEYNPDWSVGQLLFKVPDNIPSVVVNTSVERITKRIAEGHRVVVFSQFKTALKGLQEKLEALGIRTCRYDGDTPKHERLAIKRDFLLAADGTPNPDYKFDVVLANFKTGGVGLTFTEATYMLLMDEEWNPAKNRQAFARIDRIGQTRENYVEIIRVEKTISMWLKTINEHKQAIEDGFNSSVSLLEEFSKYMTGAMLNVKAIAAAKAEEEADDIVDGEIVEKAQHEMELAGIETPLDPPQTPEDMDFLDFLESM